MSENKISRKSVLQFLLQVCPGVLGALLVQCIFMHHTLSIATVNITALQDSFVRETARKALSHEEMKKKVAVFSRHLTGAISSIARERHVVLLPAEAVISGGKDYTQEVAIMVKRGMSP